MLFGKSVIFVENPFKMAVTAIQEKTSTVDQAKQGGGISWEEFEKEYLSREDQYKYEWVNGMVEITERSMNQYQFYILKNLRRFFESLRAIGKYAGELEPEFDTFFLEKIHRRPDIAYFTEDQIARMAYGGNGVPAFLIEIILTNDAANLVQQKMKNYRDAGVSVIWQIYPELQEVHVYHGEGSTICSGEKICSAAPALPDFALSANDIFKKPPMPE
jgi:Uma2 family endonuclease